MCLYAVKQVSAQGAEPAATAVADIKPLRIGDTIPRYLWHLPLQVVNHPEGRDTITLNDYRGKTILLDFLSTGCSGCIAAIPKLEAIRAEFGNEVSIIPITPQKRERVAAFIPKNKHISGTRLPFVVEDKVLKKHFPHQYISHVVWVSAKGEIRAFTGTNHVTTRTLREFLSGSPLDWPVKTENTPFFNAPLISFHEGADMLPNNTKRPLYYAMITGYTEGVGPYMPTEQDSIMGVERISYRNCSVLDLYRAAIGIEVPYDKIVLEVANPGEIDFRRADLTEITKSQWRQKYGVCYERTVPLGTDADAWRKALLMELNLHLNLFGRMAVRDGETYFILSETPESARP